MQLQQALALSSDQWLSEDSAGTVKCTRREVSKPSDATSYLLQFFCLDTGLFSGSNVDAWEFSDMETRFNFNHSSQCSPFLGPRDFLPEFPDVLDLEGSTNLDDFFFRPP